MYLDLTPEQQKDYQETLDLVSGHFDRPAKAGGDREFNRSDWQVAGDLGLLGLCAPLEHGGGGLGALDTALRIEAFGRGCPDMGLVFAVSAHLFACLVPIAEFGSPELRRRLLPKLCSGRYIAGNAMTEAGAGSDVGAVAMEAVRDGDHYILDGEKTFVSNAPKANIFVTYAATNPQNRFLGISCFAVPNGIDGLTVGPPARKLGLNGCPSGTVRFDRCRVPAEWMIGTEGQGSAVFQHSMGWERSCLFAGYLGLMDRLLDLAVQHASSRRQFGHPIADFQAVSHKIADMKLRLESARLLLYRACWLIDQGRPDQIAIALSKLAVSEASVRAALDAIQIFGGRGYLRDHGVEESLRDAVGSTIFSGTSEIQRELVARGLGL